ncbi:MULTISPECIES: thioredoxin family protein [unclassified Polaribacter]|uniref:thioredoxin family protein n=1 Tax=unclassified Polaribacter TaxID=196858 RepID=UPI0011BE9602|nr:MULTISPECIES: thioredoxin fold domain-containing protein [unclassified Polaribacter]TXD51651.1 thioredoxin family protein [Polaribacter sp. IC063]TXD58811.1 thioredoxin family protein [Polaribacter sp. IC066]
MKRTFIALAILAFLSSNITAQKINWVSLNEALELQKENPKKIMIDIYTNWCGPCKLLDKKTFQNNDVASYVNEHYYAVKFNGEGNETVHYQEKTFKNPNYDAAKAQTRNSAHEFANYMGVNAYPTIAFLSETGDFIIPLKGFYEPQQLEFYLKLFFTDKHKELKTQETFDAYYKTFEPKFKS